MEWIENTANPLMRALGLTQPSAPVWMHVQEVPPVRHPSRFRLKYRPRGQACELPMVPQPAGSAAFAAPKAKRNPTPQTKQKSRKGLLLLATAGSAFVVCAIAAGIAFMGAPAANPVEATPTPVQATAPLLITAPDFITAFADNDPATAVEPLAAAPLPEDRGSLDLITEPPAVALRLPQLDSTTVAVATPIILPDQANRPTPMDPSTLAPVSPADPFTCTGCVSGLARFEGVTVTLYSVDPDAIAVTDARAVLAAQDLRLQEIPINPARNQVRFYRAVDAAAATQLADRYGAALVDLSWFAPDIDTARIDLLLKTTPALAPTDN